MGIKNNPGIDIEIRLDLRLREAHNNGCKDALLPHSFEDFRTEVKEALNAAVCPNYRIVTLPRMLKIRSRNNERNQMPIQIDLSGMEKSYRLWDRTRYCTIDRYYETPGSWYWAVWKENK